VSTHQWQRMLPLPLRKGDPGGDHLAMDVDLVQPIVFESVPLCLDEIGTQLLQAVDVIAGSCYVAGACRAERVREPEHGFGLRVLRPWVVASRQGERRRLVPLATLDRIACRHISPPGSDVGGLGNYSLAGG